MRAVRQRRDVDEEYKLEEYDAMMQKINESGRGVFDALLTLGLLSKSWELRKIRTS
jgi:hypothetical protein